MNTPRSLQTIAREITVNWTNISPYAKPYLDAMHSLNTINDKYYADDAKSVVLYFLSNAASWRGEVARRVKKELNNMVKGA